VRSGDASVLLAVAQRGNLSARLATALIARGHQQITLRVLRRHDIMLPPALLNEIAIAEGDGAALRGALLARQDLPAEARLHLVQRVAAALGELRIVKGALAPDRLSRLLRNSADTATTAIGEREAVREQTNYAAKLLDARKLNTRMLLHAVVNGHVMFFADCLAELSLAPRSKIFALLENGSKAALSALLGRCGLDEGMRGLFVQLITYARTADLADDVAARHYVVTALTEELISEHEGMIPEVLEEAFNYLSEQNIVLARMAARGVVAAFAGETRAPMVGLHSEERRALSAA
jgi:uncharacterized protein (DUF2336 family)